MRERAATTVAGTDPAAWPASKDLTVREAILAAAELNSGVPAPRDGDGLPAERSERRRHG